MERGIIALFALLTSATFAYPAFADCSQLSAKLADGQPAHAQDVINYMSACPVFTGNVGIGTASPQGPLSVNSVDLGASPFYVTSWNGKGYSIFGPNTASATGPALGLGYSSTNNQAAIIALAPNVAWESLVVGAASFSVLSYGNVQGLYQNTSGNVGIGTTALPYTLTVNGTAYATGAQGALSDMRDKIAIAALSIAALDRIMKLRPVTFEWKKPKDDGMKGLQTGLIAQEVEKVLPATVMTANDARKSKSIKYNELTAVLIKAVQEQQKQISASQALIEKQARQIAALQRQTAEIGDLRKQIAELRRHTTTRTASR